MCDELSRKNLLFFNKGKDDIRITYLMFQSSLLPRKGDALIDNDTLLSNGNTLTLEFAGPGEVFIRWSAQNKEWADHFVVRFDPDGEPYPYIFGADKWTMALRHAALNAVSENGNH